VIFVLALYAFAKSVFAKKLNASDMGYVKGHWADVMNNVEDEPLKAIMDADKILDYVLTRHGFHGSLGEKLKSAAHKFSDLNGVWNAHKLRNKLAHELEEADEKEVKRALKQFRRALKDLGVKF
jgi:hypothetical protein